MQWGGKRPPEPKQGLRTLVGQRVTKQPDGTLRDFAERVNYDRSKYIPGNGPDHRLGR